MRGHLLSRYKLLDQNELRTRPETSFVWIIDHDGCTRTQVRSWRHGSKVARHHVGYLLNIGDARVPTMHNDHEKALVKLQRYDSVIGVTKEYTWARVNDMQALSREVKQGFETNKERLLVNNVREAVSFRARMRLIIATRLQAQHSPFRLRTLSNTSSVLKNAAWGSFANYEEENAPSILQLLS
jgi:hypothetical protein